MSSEIDGLGNFCLPTPLDWPAFEVNSHLKWLEFGSLDPSTTLVNTRPRSTRGLQSLLSLWRTENDFRVSGGQIPLWRQALVEQMAQEIDFYLKQKLDRIIQSEVEARLKDQPHLARNEIEIIRMTKLEKIKRSLEFFARPYRLNRPDTPLERVASIYEELYPARSKAALRIQMASRERRIRSFLRELIVRLFNQHVDNPAQYVSHGVDHSLNVVDYLDDLQRKNIAIVTATKNKYNIDMTEAKILLNTVALMHDLGYPQLEGRPKAYHGPIGAIYADQMFSDMMGLFRSNRIKEKDIRRDLVNAIHLHSADKIELEHQFTIKVILDNGMTYLVDLDGLRNLLKDQEFNQRAHGQIAQIKVDSEETKKNATQLLNQSKFKLISKIDVLGVKSSLKGRRSTYDKTHRHGYFGLEYREVDLLSEPLAATIRLTDNMDILPSRMTPLQRDPVFKKVYLILGNQGPTSKFVQQLEIMDIKKEELEFKRGAWKGSLKRWVKLQPHQGAMGDLNHFFLTDEEIDASVSAEEAKRKLVTKLTEQILSEPAFRTLSIAQKNEIREATLFLGSHDLPHFGGTEPIRSIDLVVDPSGKKSPKLTIQVDQQIFSRLNSIKAREENESGEIEEIPIGQYQIWRAKEASKSIYYNGEPIHVEIMD